jgi:photosystem II stability/assembly factor-like uncharacterized protein
VDDLSFRAKFHRALDPLAPAAPWLAVAVRDGLRQRRRNVRPVRRGIRRLNEPTWLLPAIAALLAIAIVVALGAGSRLLHFNQTTPVGPPQHGLGAPAGCPGWSTNPSGLATVSDRMTSITTGWAGGVLRTTDGGTKWQRMAPDGMLSDAPPGTDRKAYPPGYTDFFLDSNHASLAYGYPSANSCFDHVTVFSTADGGQTWKRSNPVNAAIQSDTSLQLLLDFVDPQHGWLFVLASGRLAPDWFVYYTANGGVDWQLASQLPQIASFCGVDFISESVGFLGGCLNSGGLNPDLPETRDGGKTWDTVRLPVAVGSQFTFGDPVFFDQNRGIIHITAQIFQGNTESPSDYLATTDDGGLTWRALPPLTLPGYAQTFDFVDPNHFFVLLSDGKGASESIYKTVDGGATWSLSSGNLLPLYQTYPEVMFVDAQHGFIDEPGQQIGQGPSSFLATTDGGRTWRDMHPQVT